MFLNTLLEAVIIELLKITVRFWITDF